MECCGLRNGKGEGCYATAVRDIELMAGGGRYRAGWLDACWRAIQTISRAVNAKCGPTISIADTEIDD